jgi:hypothetical protein
LPAFWPAWNAAQRFLCPAAILRLAAAESTRLGREPLIAARPPIC